MNLNLAYLDPPKYGWTAIGGISSILEPHERARRGIDASDAAAAKAAETQPASGGEGDEKKEECYYTILDETKEEAPKQMADEDGQPSNDKPGDNAEETKEPIKPSPKQISIQTTKSNVLDIYTYHRGRVGQEPRSASGELLAPTDPVDTNHDWTPSPTLIRITLDFPLTNEHRFKDLIEWDISSSLSVEEFASSLATEFNLSFRTTMEIIESLSRQIQSHVVKHTKFYPPMVIKDAYQNDRPDSQFGYCDDVTECFGRREDEILQEGKRSRGGVVTINRGRKKRGDRSSSGGERRSRPMGAVKPQRGIIEVVPQNEVPKANKDNDPHAAEVLRRAKLESQEISNECKARGDTVLWHATNEVCHICHNRKPLVLTFHCGSHSYCDFHCASRLSFRAKEYDPSNPIHPIDHCPVCTLQCTCSKCTRRLETVTNKLKTMCEVQGCGPDQVQMSGGVLSLCNAKLTGVPKDKVQRKITPHGGGTFRGVGGSKKDSNKSGGAKRKFRGEESLEIGDRPVKKMRRSSTASLKSFVMKEVLKVNPSEFPKELHEGKDTDPAQPGDYERCFAPVGSSIPPQSAVDQKYQDIIMIPLADVPSNMDYCIVCGEMGDLTDCANCPRSYHAECLVKDRGDADEETECPRCKLDSKVSAEEDEALLNLPMNTHIKETYGTFTHESKLLELIVQIVRKLTAYDFGDIFAEPVNTDFVPNYLETIKTPMDYRTLIEKLEGGMYPNASIEFTKEMNEIETIILHVLCDIEQVHHNCLFYNQKSSNYYRIGYVHSIKWKAYYKKHISGSLSDNVKANLKEFRAKCKTIQETQVRTLDGTKPGNKCSNEIGVFDPDTKKVVKIYTSKAAAIRAADALKLAGYECEFELEERSWKTIMDKITLHDSTALLFGYRWIPMESLRSGQFSLDGKADGSTEKVVIWKQDTVSDQKLQGFSSDEAAYNDWLVVRSTAISIDPSIGEDMASFKQHYVDRSNTINGIAWNRVAPPVTDTVSSEELVTQQDTVLMGEQAGRP